MNQTPDPNRQNPLAKQPAAQPRAAAPQPGSGGQASRRPAPSGNGRTPQNARAERRQKQSTTLLAIFVVIALTMCLLIGLIFSELNDSVDNLKNKRGESGESTTTTNVLTSSQPGTTTEKVTVSMDMVTVQKTRAEMSTGLLQIVDADHAYVFPASESQLISLYGNIPYAAGTTTRLYQLRKTYSIDRTALTALNQMAQAFYDEFQTDSLIVNWAYRSMEDQQAQYQAYAVDYPGYTDVQIREMLRNKVDTPGYSEHHLGTCVDLKVVTEAGNSVLEKNPTYFTWLTQNCWRYGFVFRSPANGSQCPSDSYNPYYFRYIGLPHAYYIQENGICLEKYLEDLRTATSPEGEHLSVTLDDGSEYEVYYVSATGNITDVSVPKNHPYVISGDNNGGFVVTVTIH